VLTLRHMARSWPLRDPAIGELCWVAEGKTQLLKDIFFPPVAEADLADLEGFNYPPPLEDCPEITAEEIRFAIYKPAQDKAPGPDGIPHRILRLLSGPLSEPLRLLFNACLHVQHHPSCFRVATTIALRKPSKPNYMEPKAWRPIALLNTIGKALEAVIARRLRYFAEHYRLLPEAQHGCRRQRDTTTALELLTEQVHTVWGQGTNKVATLLSLDMTGAFDRVSHERLLHNLRRKGIPEPLTGWVCSFLRGRQTSLVLGEHRSEPFAVATGIPQGSPISPILFLFFNMELVELCTRSALNVAGIGFVDDVNILAYGTSTEDNCRTLSRIHDGCLAWAKRHGASFAPHKYELMHLTRCPRRFNMAATLQLGDIEQAPVDEVRVLGVQLDTKLRWGRHINKVRGRMAQQSRALSAIATSTWGASFSKARLVFNAVVRPAMTYGAVIWATPGDLPPSRRTWAGSPLDTQQNRCLRIVSGAYRATGLQALERETATPPLRVHVEQLQLQARARLEASGARQEVEAACARIRRRLQPKRGRRRPPIRDTPGQRKHSWARATLWPDAPLENTTTHLGQAPWKALAPPAAPPCTYTITKTYQNAQKWATNRWRLVHALTPPGRSWDPGGPAGYDAAPYPKTLELHAGLPKALSSILTQVRTGKIGLAAFLWRSRVPGYDSPACRCGWQRETAKHILVDCPIYAEQRRELTRRAATTDYRVLVTHPRAAAEAAAWLIRIGIFSQFSWARAQLLPG